jgi:hypothetical protein
VDNGCDQSTRYHVWPLTTTLRNIFRPSRLSIAPRSMRFSPPSISTPSRTGARSLPLAAEAARACHRRAGLAAAAVAAAERTPGRLPPRLWRGRLALLRNRVRLAPRVPPGAGAGRHQRLLPRLWLRHGRRRSASAPTTWPSSWSSCTCWRSRRRTPCCIAMSIPGGAEQVEVCVAAQAKFLGEHLGTWVDLFAQSLALNTQDAPYLPLAQVHRCPCAGRGSPAGRHVLIAAQPQGGEAHSLRHRLSPAPPALSSTWCVDAAAILQRRDPC